MALEKELATYTRELPNLLASAGKFALVNDVRVVSVWATYADAIQEGYRLFGLNPFLVKKIEAIEQPHHFSRDVRPICRS